MAEARGSITIYRKNLLPTHPRKSPTRSAFRITRVIYTVQIIHTAAWHRDDGCQAERWAPRVDDQGEGEGRAVISIVVQCRHCQVTSFIPGEGLVHRCLQLCSA